MKIIALLAPYILVPWLLAWTFKKLSLFRIWFTYMITGILIIIYPIVLFSIENYVHPPTPGPKCGMLEFSLQMANIILMLPFSLVTQFFFNRYFFRNPGSGK